MYRHIRNSSLEAWCVRIPLTTVISANVIVVETGLYSNKSTLLKPLKLEWNVAVMKMKRFKWLGISEKTRNSLGFWQKSFTEVLCLSSMNASFQFYHHFCYTHLQKGSKLLLLKNANLDLKRTHLMPWCNLTFRKTWHVNGKMRKCRPIGTKHRSPYLPVLFGIKQISFLRSR